VILAFFLTKAADPAASGIVISVTTEAVVDLVH